MRHFASHAGFAGALEALIECGAYVHSVDKAGGAMLPWGAKFPRGPTKKTTAPRKTGKSLGLISGESHFRCGEKVGFQKLPT